MINRDFNLYKIFLTLYEQKNISKTANILFVSQPAISYSLKELEDQLGYSLFYRNSKGIEPTIEAKELYSYISTAFNIIHNGEQHIQDMNNLNIGTIKIGVPSHLAIFLLANVISDFRKMYPGIKFEIISKSTSDMVSLLETRKINLIVDTLPINTTNKSIKKKVLKKLQNCFVYNSKLLGDLQIKKMSDLKKYPLILPSATSSIRMKLDEVMEKNDIQLSPVIETWTTELMLEFVKNGVGIGYFIKDMIDIQKNQSDFKIVNFDNPLLTIDVCAVYLEQFESLALHKFIEYLTINIKEGESK